MLNLHACSISQKNETFFTGWKSHYWIHCGNLTGNSTFRNKVADLCIAVFPLWVSWVDLSNRSHWSEPDQHHSYPAETPPGWYLHPKNTTHTEKNTIIQSQVSSWKEWNCFCTQYIFLFLWWCSHLARQWYFNRYRNNFSQEAAIEGHPEHPRVTVGVHQRHLPRH